MDNGFHERYRRRLGEELRISVKLLLGLLTEGDNCIDDNSPQLERFCLVVEKAFLHGLQGSTSAPSLFFGGWGLAQLIPTLCPSSARILLKSTTLLAQTQYGAGRSTTGTSFKTLPSACIALLLLYLSVVPGAVMSNHRGCHRDAISQTARAGEPLHRERAGSLTSTHARPRSRPQQAESEEAMARTVHRSSSVLLTLGVVV